METGNSIITQLHIMKQASDVESILLNEVDNEKYVYLYLEGDTWCAYERSAYYLAMEFPVVLDKEIVHDGYEVILMTLYGVQERECLNDPQGKAGDRLSR